MNIVPTVRYYSLVWGTCSPTLVNEIDHMHVRATKMIFRLPDDISDQDALTSINWKPISDLYKK